jgi:hypothetical protein
LQKISSLFKLSLNLDPPLDNIEKKNGGCKATFKEFSKGLSF